MKKIKLSNIFKLFKSNKSKHDIFDTVEVDYESKFSDFKIKTQKILKDNRDQYVEKYRKAMHNVQSYGDYLSEHKDANILIRESFGKNNIIGYKKASELTVVFDSYHIFRESNMMYIYNRHYYDYRYTNRRICVVSDTGGKFYFCGYNNSNELYLIDDSKSKTNVYENILELKSLFNLHKIRCEDGSEESDVLYPDIEGNDSCGNRMCARILIDNTGSDNENLITIFGHLS